MQGHTLQQSLVRRSPSYVDTLQQPSSSQHGRPRAVARATVTSPAAEALDARVDVRLRSAHWGPPSRRHALAESLRCVLRQPPRYPRLQGIGWLPQALAAHYATGVWNRRDDKLFMGEALRAVEAKEGPALPRAVLDRLPHADFERALALRRARLLGHRLDGVETVILPAAGRVAGQVVDSGEVLAYRFRPRDPSRASGVVYVVSPGYQECGDSFLGIFGPKSRGGAGLNDTAEVVCLDHAWLSALSERPGHVPAGNKVALETWAAVQWVFDHIAEDYDQPLRVVLLGHSMGGGPGLLLPLLRHQCDEIQLDGAHAPIPKALGAVLLSPYLNPTPGIYTGLVTLGSYLPLVSEISVAGNELPTRSRDGETHAACAARSEDMVIHDAQARMQAMTHALGDMDATLEATSDAVLPNGAEVLQARGDELADPAAVQEVVERYGLDFTAVDDLPEITESTHVFHFHPSARALIVSALERQATQLGAALMALQPPARSRQSPKALRSHGVR